MRLFHLSMIGSSGGTRAGGDCAVNTGVEESSTGGIRLTAECQIENLSGRSGRGQAIGLVDRENLLLWATGRRDEIGSIQRGSGEIQIRNQGAETGNVLGLSGENAGGRGDNAGCGQ